MRLYVFKSEAQTDLRAFAGDPAGSKLPSRFAPWHAVGVVAQRGPVECGRSTNVGDGWRGVVLEEKFGDFVVAHACSKDESGSATGIGLIEGERIVFKEAFNRGGISLAG